MKTKVTSPASVDVSSLSEENIAQASEENSND